MKRRKLKRKIEVPKEPKAVEEEPVLYMSGNNNHRTYIERVSSIIAYRMMCSCGLSVMHTTHEIAAYSAESHLREMSYNDLKKDLMKPVKIHNTDGWKG